MTTDHAIQDVAERIHAIPAPIRAVTMKVDELMALARKHAYDPSIFDDQPPFFARAHISNNSVDAYFTRMHESTLKNFAADAEAGVSVQNSHITRQLGFGRSISGAYIGAQGNGLARVESDFYTIPGIKLNDVSTDDFIRGVRAGLIHDISVGFYGGTLSCSICGRDYWDWECHHIPGVEYKRLDSKGNETDEETAVFWVKDARLAEYSTVYDGATEGAAILAIKVQQEADAGRLRPETARLLEARYRFRIRGADHLWGGSPARSVGAGDGNESETKPSAERAAEPSEPEMNMETEGRDMELTDAERGHLALGQVVSTLLDGRKLVQDGETPDAAITRLVDENARLRPLADEGRAYRTDLIEDTLKEGVRAMGADFPRETYAGVLERASLDEIKRFRSDWAAIATRALPGGRATVDSEEPPAEEKPKRQRVPDHAYAS